LGFFVRGFFSFGFTFGERSSREQRRGKQKNQKQNKPQGKRNVSRLPSASEVLLSEAARKLKKPETK